MHDHQNNHHCHKSSHCSCGEHKPAVRGFLIPCLLLLLDKAPSHGYQIAERLQEKEYLSHLPDPGVIYRHLRKMEQDELVTSSFEPGAGPARKVYSITDEGRDCLKAWISALRQMCCGIDAFLEDVSKETSGD